MFILCNAKFSNLMQCSFDEIYQSKVTVLEALLGCIHPAMADFMLLFSTVGSVGNAGQAIYNTSQP
ncbi:hypothetical protein L210DRAFT_858003 [Boletus edulis BED1]|uniref:Ketoreductase (KR) domain-containing protein n=1 Tax=Boletus edulis BED1 TaxID=1328754 RepID=A0AAD4BU40_BOLED|nr:hypothetical protein L210DRAFT_858003 [Boletus edulis BED1]